VPDPIVSGPGEGERLEGEHRLALVKVLADQLDVLEYHVGPGYDGPGPHYHRRHTDAFYVLDGELEFTVAGETVRAPAGTSVVVPPHVVHGFTNPGPGDARFLNAHAPETGFVELMRARGRGEDPDATEYDIYDADGPGTGDGAAVVRRGEGERHERSERVRTIRGETEPLSMIEFEVERDWGVDPHHHDDHLDSFYVLEGEIEFFAGDGVVNAPAGTLIAAPPGAVHGVVAARTPVRLLNLHAPDAGFVGRLRES
jgi:quercetin dioxygenase-like cupin family protein